MPSSKFLIASNTLTTTAASVTFSSIPATYADLCVVISARDNASAVQQQMLMRINGDTSNLYSWTWIEGNGSTASSSRNDGSYIGTSDVVSANATANTFNNMEVYIPNYTVSQNRPISIFAVAETNATAAEMDAIAGLYRSTTSITSLTFLCAGAANFVSGSTFWLYGLKSS